MVRETSKQAYDYILKNGILDKRHWQTYDYLFRFGPLTPNEVHAKIEEMEGYTNKPSITPRFARLERMGIIRELGERICSVTKMTCCYYDVTSKVATRQDFLESKLPSRKELEAENKELKELLKETINRFDAYVAQEQRHQVESLDSAGATPVVSTNFKDESSKSHQTDCDP